MKYKISLSNQALKDISEFKKSGQVSILRKIETLLFDISQHPTTGLGKPEQLKYFETPTWSRRITDKHRLVYRIENEIITILVLSVYGHYDDK